MSKRSRTEKGKQPESSTSPFVSQNASHRYSIIHYKHIISERTMVLADFEHLNLANIFRSNSLEFLVTIKEPVHLKLVAYFYSNLSFQENHIKSRVLGVDINISLEKFARLLHLSCEGVDIHNLDLHEFEYPRGESALTASYLLHEDENPALARNEEVKYYTLTAQVLVKIVFYNLLPKLGEYSHAGGLAPLLIYCLLNGVKVNFSKLIIISCSLSVSSSPTDIFLMGCSSPGSLNSSKLIFRV